MASEETHNKAERKAPAIAVHADKTDVEHSEYMATQMREMARFIIHVLHTGPEQSHLTGENWKELDAMARGRVRVSKHLSRNPQVSYLTNYWISKFAMVFGTLARIDREPLEQVDSLEANFQYAVADHVGQLRYHWHQNTGQVLGLSSALEQIRWDGPKIQYFNDGDLSHIDPNYEGLPCLHVSALFPHVVPGEEEGQADLMFDSEHISTQTLITPVSDEHIDEIRKEIDLYSRI